MGGEARRLMAERAVLAAELHVEEKAAVHARDLVVSCHAALLRQQAEGGESRRGPQCVVA